LEQLVRLFLALVGVFLQPSDQTADHRGAASVRGHADRRCSRVRAHMQELEMGIEPAGNSQSRCEHRDVTVAAGCRNEYGLDHRVSPVGRKCRQQHASSTSNRHDEYQRRSLAGETAPQER